MRFRGIDNHWGNKHRHPGCNAGHDVDSDLRRSGKQQWSRCVFGPSRRRHDFKQGKNSNLPGQHPVLDCVKCDGVDDTIHSDGSKSMSTRVHCWGRGSRLTYVENPVLLLFRYQQRPAAMRTSTTAASARPIVKTHWILPFSAQSVWHRCKGLKCGNIR